MSSPGKMEAVESIAYRARRFPPARPKYCGIDDSAFSIRAGSRSSPSTPGSLPRSRTAGTIIGSTDYVMRRGGELDKKKPLPWWSNDKGGMSTAAPLTESRASFPTCYDLDVAKAALTVYDAEKAALWRRAFSGGEPFTATSTSQRSFLDTSGQRTPSSPASWRLAELKRDTEKVAKDARSREARAGDDLQRASGAETCGGALRWWSPEELAAARARPTFTSCHTTSEPFVLGTRKGGRKFAAAENLPTNWVPYEGE